MGGPAAVGNWAVAGVCVVEDAWGAVGGAPLVSGPSRTDPLSGGPHWGFCKKVGTLTQPHPTQKACYMFEESSSETKELLPSASEGRQSTEVQWLSPTVPGLPRQQEQILLDWSWPKLEDLGGPPILNPQVWQNFWVGMGHLGWVKSKRMTLVGWEYSPKPSFDNASAWVAWQAEHGLTSPSWWPELIEVPNQKDIHQFVRRVWASF